MKLLLPWQRVNVPDGYARIRHAKNLLRDKSSARWVTRIRQLAGVTDRLWDGVYLPVLMNVADLMQSTPRSRFGEPDAAGSALDHTLEEAAAALIARNDLENPFSSSQDDVVLKREVFSYAVFVAASCERSCWLLDNREYMLLDRQGNAIDFEPFGRSLAEQASYYNVVKKNNADDAAHTNISSLFLYQHLPNDGLNWLFSHDEVLRWLIESWRGLDNPIRSLLDTSLGGPHGHPAIDRRAPKQNPTSLLEAENEKDGSLNATPADTASEKKTLSPFTQAS